jgi:tRNA 2-selenouridine synthase
MPGGWRPLVYCWRGGQRSGSFATILGQVGWRVELVQGGYKAWRKLVVEALEKPPAAPVVILDGNTGSAKTELLALLAERGVQTVDLESLANHRGSLFGHMPGGQPSQKAFEGRVAMALAALDPAQPVVVEAESSRIGDLAVPKGLWAAMTTAQRIHIRASLPARAAYLARAYADLSTDADRLTAVIGRLRPAHAAETIAGWLDLAAAGETEALAADLMRRHYDPRYEKHRARYARPEDPEVTALDLAPEALPGLAYRIATAIATLQQR